VLSARSIDTDDADVHKFVKDCPHGSFAVAGFLAQQGLAGARFRPIISRMIRESDGDQHLGWGEGKRP
jgi:hypothetical protein